MTTTFETAKVGDKVWSLKEGWGKIVKIDKDSIYPIDVRYNDGSRDTFTFGGYMYKSDSLRILFWDEVVIKAPKKPLPHLEVDAKVIVWSNGIPRLKRHFSHFNESGKIVCFANGMSSWVTELTREWPYWELPK